jgi:hypothetical protein
MNAIETDRLTLEPLTAAHAEEMFAALSDPGICEFESQVTPVVRHNEIANGEGGM